MYKFITVHSRTIQMFGNHSCQCTLLGFCSSARYCCDIVKHHEWIEHTKRHHKIFRHNSATILLEKPTAFLNSLESTFR